MRAGDMIVNGERETVIIDSQSVVGRERKSTVEMVDAILPAGGRLREGFARQVGTDVKALIRIGGKTLLERTVTALHESGQVRNCVVIGPEEAQEEALRCGAQALSEADSGPANVFAGLAFLREQTTPARALLLATDMPFVTADSLRSYLDRCPPDADIVAPVMTAAAFLHTFPESPNTWTTLREGPMTLGGAFLVNPAALYQNREHVDRVFAARKSNMAMAQLFGLSFILRFITRTLSISQIEQKCASILHCSAHAVQDAPPELAFDIDQSEEYLYAVRHFERIRGAE